MSGDHNMYCSANQPDIVERLRGGIKHPQQNVSLREEAADEIERLRNELDRERVRLAACSTAALGYFKGCKDEYWSAALDDVLKLRYKFDAAMEANRE